MLSRTQKQLLLAAFCLVWAVAACAQDVVVKLEGTGYKFGSEDEARAKALEGVAEQVLECKFPYWFRAEAPHPQFWVILGIEQPVENSRITLEVIYERKPISGDQQEKWSERLIQDEFEFKPHLLHAIPRTAKAWEVPVRSSLERLLRRNEKDIKTALRKIRLGQGITGLPREINPTSSFFYPVLNLRWDQKHKDFPRNHIFLLDIQAMDGPLALEAVGTGEVKPIDSSNTAYGVVVRVDKFSNTFTYDLTAYKTFADIREPRRIKQAVRFVWYGGDVVVAP